MRGTALIIIGLLLHYVNRHNLKFTLSGTLQTIGMVYLIAVVVTRLPRSWHFSITIAILLLHVLALTAVYPGPTPWPLRWEKGYTTTEYLDALVFGAGASQGLLDFPNGAACILIGLLVGRQLFSAPLARSNLLLIGSVGLALTALGLLLDSHLLRATPLFVPINKRVWTSSFVIYSTGLAIISMLLLFVTIEIKKISRPFWPLTIYGSNAIAVYIFTGLLYYQVLEKIRVVAQPDHVDLKTWIYRTAAEFAGPAAGSLIYTALILASGWLFNFILWKKRWFLRL